MSLFNWGGKKKEKDKEKPKKEREKEINSLRNRTNDKAKDKSHDKSNEKSKDNKREIERHKSFNGTFNTDEIPQIGVNTNNSSNSEERTQTKDHLSTSMKGTPVEGMTITLSLSTIMNTPEMYIAFRKFALEGRCGENIKFWEAVCEFKLHAGNPNHDPNELLEEATQIYHSHIKMNSPLQINVASATLHMIETMLAENKTSNSMFDKAQSSVLEVIKHDVFPRYLKAKFLATTTIPEKN